MFVSAVDWTGGRSPWRRLGDRLDQAEDDSFVTMLFGLLLAMLNTVFATIQLAIDAIAMADHRRAEYAADLASRDAAGSQGAIAMLDRLTLLGDLVDGLVHDVVTKRPDDWGALADRRHAQLQDRLDVRRQASRRMVDLWVTHPPNGSRAALIEGLPRVQGTVSVDPAQSARIDVELGNWYRAAHREILGTREFLG
jgi:Zn-dependent protease with chaperone function